MVATTGKYFQSLYLVLELLDTGPLMFRMLLFRLHAAITLANPIGDVISMLV